MKKLDINMTVIYGLAECGYSVTMIADALQIARSTIYKHSDIIDAIKSGHSTARLKVVDDLMKRSEEDLSATASIFLAKQLKVFDDYYPTGTPKTIEDALTKITDIYQAVASNELSQEKGTHLIKYLDSFVKGYEANVLEGRIEKLEELAEKEK